jgi:hypothetical protein
VLDEGHRIRNPDAEVRAMETRVGDERMTV